VDPDANFLSDMHVCFYPKLLQAFACPAIIDSHGAVFTPGDDVIVVSSEAHYRITMKAQTFNQWFSSCTKKKKDLVSLSKQIFC